MNSDEWSKEDVALLRKLIEKKNHMISIVANFRNRFNENDILKKAIEITKEDCEKQPSGAMLFNEFLEDGDIKTDLAGKVVFEYFRKEMLEAHQKLEYLMQTFINLSLNTATKQEIADIMSFEVSVNVDNVTYGNSKESMIDQLLENYMVIRKPILRRREIDVDKDQ